jgi:hypothetical protein
MTVRFSFFFLTSSPRLYLRVRFFAALFDLKQQQHQQVVTVNNKKEKKKIRHDRHIASCMRRYFSDGKLMLPALAG